MFERFTDRARRTLVIAQEEARTLEHAFIRPEHLLLGLIRGEGMAATALSELGVRYDAVREKVTRDVPATPGAGHLGKVPFSPQAKKALELSLREALRLGHNYIGTEHILLGLLREADAKDNEVKEILGGLAVQLRARVIELHSLLWGSETKDHEVKDILGGLSGQLRSRVIELVASASRSTSGRSPAMGDALRRATELAGQATVTTGHLLTALIADTASQACKALEVLGVTEGSLAAALDQVAVEATSDATPGAATVEVKVGDVTTTIDDPDLARKLQGLTPDQVRAVLVHALGQGPEHKAAG